MDSKHAFWKGHIAAWQSGEQTQRAYCREHALSLASFGYWRRKLMADAVAPTKGLIPIVTADADTRGVLAIGLPNRLTLQVPLSVEPARVVAWIRALGTC